MIKNLLIKLLTKLVGPITYEDVELEDYKKLDENITFFRRKCAETIAALPKDTPNYIDVIELAIDSYRCQVRSLQIANNSKHRYSNRFN